MSGTTPTRTRDNLVLLLALNSGATDAIGFVALGGAFTSVMTGNMVLLGLGLPRQDWTLVAHSGAAIASFVIGCVVGTRVAGTAGKDEPPWPPAVTRALLVQLVAVTVFAVGWESTGGHPTGGLQLALLAVNAIALGIQSSAVQRFGTPGLSTTYLTGTLTTLVIRLSSGRPVREVRHSGLLLLALIGGAAAGAALARYAAPVAGLLPLVCVLIVIIGGRRVSTLVDEHRLA